MDRGRSAAAAPGAALWHFALEAYTRPGVTSRCLALQDREGAVVMVMLQLCALAAHGAEPSGSDLPGIAARGECLERHLIAPLRAARRALAAAGRDLPECGGAVTAQRLLASELAQERLQANVLADGGAAVHPSGPACAGTGAADRAVRLLEAYLAHLGVTPELAHGEARALAAAVFADAPASEARV